MIYLVSTNPHSRPRINVRTIRKIPENGGLTLRNGCPVQFKTGYQGGVRGEIFHTPEEVSRFLHTVGRKGDWGIWRDNGLWYVDESKHIATKKAALALGVACNQLSIYSWAKDDVIWC